MKKTLFKLLEEKVIDAQKGNKEAFSDIYDLTHEKVYFYAVQILRNTEDAEEIVQEVYADLVRDIHAVKYPDFFVAYINKKTYYMSMNYARRKNRSIPIDKDDEAFATLEDEAYDDQPEYAFLQSEKQRALIKGIDHLPLKHKSVILMHYYEELPLKQISEIMDCSLGTVKSRLNTARGYLKNAIEMGTGSKSVFLSLSLGKSIKGTLDEMAKSLAMDSGKSTALASKSGIDYTKTGQVVGAKVVSGIALKTVIIGVSALMVASSGVGLYMLNDKETREPVILTSVTSSTENTFSNAGSEIKARVEGDSIEEVYLLFPDGNRKNMKENGNQTYTGKVYKHGSYIVYAKGNGEVQEKSIEVKGIDNVAPIATSYEIVGEDLSVTCVDEYSGIDWERSMAMTGDGDKVSPKEIRKNENKLIFKKTGLVSFEIFDKAGNSTVYMVEPK